MKRVIFILFAVLFGGTLTAQQFTIGDLTYQVLNGSNSVEVYDCNSSATSVDIPSTVTNNETTYGVTTIGADAFMDCSSLTSVTIPNSVTSIGECAFLRCHSLTSIIIGNSVTSIGGGVFSDCSSLTSVTIPNSVTSIGIYAFIGCSSLTAINVASGNTHYSSIDGILYNHPQDTLIQCPGAKKSVIIPNSTVIIGDYAFCDCDSLSSVIIPNSITAIGNDAFSSCSNLTSVTIPNSTTYIGKGAFSSCSNLTAINVASGNTHYSSIDGILYNYVQDTLIQCPGTKTSVTIPNSVTSIGYRAFSNCNSLTSATIPNSVISIGDYAFFACNKLISVAIGNSVTSIGFMAFYVCKSLTSVIIGNSVTSIGDFALSYCDSLTSVVSLADIPPALGVGCFIDNDPSYFLTVPCGSLTAYQTSEWSEWFDIDHMTGSYYSEISATINEGETYTEHGFNESEEGIYIQRIENNNDCDSVIMLHLFVNVSLSAVGINEGEIMLYPNPAKDFVRLERGEATERMQVVLFDINGRMVREYVFPQGQRSLEINLEGLPAGLYSVKAGNISRKLIVE